MKTLLLAVTLLVCPALYAQGSLCTSPQTYRANNAWTAGQTIPYGMVLEIYNPLGSGCDLYIIDMTFSAGSNVAYEVFGTAFATALMPGCSSNVQVTSMAAPFTASSLPGGIAAVGLPCGTYIGIGTVSDGRWTLANGRIYEEDFGGKFRKVPPGFGYSLWTSPAGYPAVPNSVGDLTITLDVKTCPSGSTC